jgi:site-specific recombinase XerD
MTEQAMPARRLDPSGLSGADINAFLLRECARVSSGSAKGRVAELRALLRYLHVGGLIGSDLSAAVPPVGGWRLASIPRLVSRQDVERVVAAPDPATANGARDRAILLLVARLGLRCVEVEHLRLDDIDWRSGKITIRGKARREDQMPLPAEAGEAISAYLALRGSYGPGREVFWTCRAPRKPIGRALVSDVVRDRCEQVGIAPFGAHRLRHALAGQMLRGGADLAAISQVLRHQDLATTAVYAKVDLATLRLVAQPWPETAA